MPASTILATLHEHGVAYLVVGRAAVLLHQGTLDATLPLTLCYRQEWSNSECLDRALEQLGAEMLPRRGAPIPATVELRQASEPLEFRSPAGSIHLLPAVPELGAYDELQGESASLEVGGLEVRVLSAAQIERWLARCRGAGGGGGRDVRLDLWPRRPRGRRRSARHDAVS